MEVQSTLSSDDDVLHQHGGGDSTDTAGNGSDLADNRLDLVELAVALHAALALGGDLLGVPVHGNVDDGLAGTDHVTGDGVQNAGSADDQVGVGQVSHGILGLGVDGGDGAVSVLQHQGDGTADDQGTAHDGGALCGVVKVVVIQDLDAGLSGAGREAQIVAALVDAGVGQVGHGVHVLLGIQAVADLVLSIAQVLGQGTEHQAAVDGIIGIDLVDDSQQLFLGAVSIQNEILDVDADDLSALGSALLVGQVRGVLANADDGQSGVNALFLQGSGTLDQVGVQGIGNFLAGQNFSHFSNPPESVLRMKISIMIYQYNK